MGCRDRRRYTSLSSNLRPEADKGSAAESYQKTSTGGLSGCACVDTVLALAYR